MRIIAGKHKGRKLHLVGKPTTRETADMVKTAVFNMLGGTLSGTVLDLYAGSGAYGIEAISRGASFCYAIDSDKDAYTTILKNIDMMGITSLFKVIHQTDQQFIKHLSEEIHFDYIFLDPPYDLNIYEQVIKDLTKHTHEKTMIICESKKDVILEDHIHIFRKVKEKVYGIKRVSIYER